MNYLVDTNVISAFAPDRHERPAGLSEWFESRSEKLYLSVVTSMEIRDGIAKAFREGASRKAQNLAGWWDMVEHLYGARILAFDLQCATVAGAMNDRARATGSSPGFADISVAATAAVHGLTILTRNMKHFVPVYDKVRDPFLDVLE